MSKILTSQIAMGAIYLSDLVGKTATFYCVQTNFGTAGARITMGAGWSVVYRDCENITFDATAGGDIANAIPLTSLAEVTKVTTVDDLITQDPVIGAGMFSLVQDSTDPRDNGLYFNEINPGSDPLNWLKLGPLYGGLVNMQVFATAGSFTYTPTTGASRILVMVTGGGGAGGGAATGATKSCGRGGEAGATRVVFMSLVKGLTGAVTVGAGGTGVSESTGGAGENSTFVYNGTTITGGGGNGGTVIQDASWAFSLATSTASASGGANGFTIRTIPSGIAMTTNATNTLLASQGGNSYYNGGGLPKGTNTSGASNGANASGSGSGGGGAYQTSNTGATGGNGGAGAIVIFEYA